MPVAFQGYDHIDVRVKSLAAVESFYDAFLAEVGLPRKRRSHVDAAGEWLEASDERPYNVSEYFEEIAPGKVAFFIGIIEDTGMQPTKSRIAFRLASRSELDRMHHRLEELGARRIELSEDMNAYPAIFFEDAAGTKLELCARHTPADGY
jgi:catechol 2,3-dioxygenase-like lactoylglutathione lyase family enzyme